MIDNQNFRCSDTTVACCTPQGGTGGSLAVIRISGPQAIAVADRCARLSSKKRLCDQPSHTIHHGVVVGNDGTVLDEVMFALMQAPKTFTGEHTVEITSHNNMLIIDRVVAALIQAGARIAERGEFTRQALHNKKLDLVQAEAIHELIMAGHTQDIQASLAQLAGSMSHEVGEIEQSLITAMAWCEASFEFVEEVGTFEAKIKSLIEATISRIQALRNVHGIYQVSREGFRIALIGAVNAGKSSLFNALVGKERAIVAPIAGTTRDTIESRIVRQGMVWTLIDTAGIRETHDSIEQQGIERSWFEAYQADLILLAVPCSHDADISNDVVMKYYEALIERRRESIILVYTKADLSQKAPAVEGLKTLSCTAVSALTREGIEALEHCMKIRLDDLYKTQKMPFIVNKRHAAILMQLEEQLNEIVQFFEHSFVAYELISHHLRLTIEKLGEMSGKTVSDAALDQVFKDFCIGK
jgi:tRNA modification GTPase